MAGNAHYARLRDRVKNVGGNYSPRGLATKELLAEKSTFYIGEVVGRPKMNVKLGIMEGLQMIAGTASVEAVERVAPKVDCDLFTLMSFYGPRIRDQVPTILKELERDPLSRRAVLTVAADPIHDIPRNLEPCTIAIQLLIRGYLHVVAYMRSSDVVWGVPYDVMQFGLFGLAMADCLGVKPGWVYLVGGSVHEYGETARIGAEGDARYFDAVVPHYDYSGDRPFDRWVDWRSWAIRLVDGATAWGEDTLPHGVCWSPAPAMLLGASTFEDTG